MLEKMRRVGWPTRLILLLSTVVLAATVIVAFLAASDDNGPSAAVTDMVVPADEAGVTAGGQSATSNDATGSTLGSEAVLDSSDPVAAGVMETCARLRSGATVDEVAIWFENGWDGSTEELETMFHEIVEQALTQECPDVLPAD